MLSTDPVKPSFTEAEIKEILLNTYGIEGQLKALVGDIDQNVKVSCGDKSYVFKLSSPVKDTGFLALQNSALQHLGVCAPALTVPQIVPTLNGLPLGQANKDKALYPLRLLTYIEGTLFCNAGKTTTLFSALGKYIGQLSRGLQGFGHPAAHQGADFLWNLDNILACEGFIPSIKSAENRALVTTYFERYRKHVLPHIRTLRGAVIHNDINDNNILVGKDGASISAVIDFGDLVYARQVNELATSLAYALFDQDDLLATSHTMIHAYTTEFPLFEQEADLLFDLVAMRLIMSASISSHRAAKGEDDPYLVVSQAPAFRLLARLAEVDRDIWSAHARKAGCLAYKTPNATSEDEIDIEKMQKERVSLLGPSLNLAYENKLNIVRGNGAYLYDHTGRAYLDCVNNISHVGHCHPHVTNALVTQAQQLNTNTRYLHKNIQKYAAKLLATLPDPLSVVYFVCSGSEANELALRLARTRTGRKHMVVLDWAYHGNTTSLIEISPYKFNRKGGAGQPSHVQVADLPDLYRGRHKHYQAEAGRAYAESVRQCIHRVTQQTGEGPAAFIAESIAGVGGQIMFPPGYLRSAYAATRATGGVCIADEVQVGFGRVGTHMWAFEQQGVVPDIITLGKPMGNGHPMAAVVTTREIADAFANGMEYFNSFGGNPVSCAVGLAVMEVMDKEGLQAHALETGFYLMDGLNALKTKHRLIGDVRGTGLFIGIELVKNHETLYPASAETNRVVQYCREQGVLLSADGPFENVIKIKPPMVFGKKEADILLSTLEKAFSAF